MCDQKGRNGGGPKVVKNGKYHNQTKQFLKEACTLIELGNLVDSFALGRINISKPYISNNRADTSNNRKRDPKRVIKESVERRAFASCPKSDARHHTTHQIRPNTPVTRHIRKTIEFIEKGISKEKLKCFKAEVDKDMNRRNRQELTCPCKMPSSKRDENVSTKVKESVVRNRNLSPGSDMARICTQLHLLNDLSSCANVYKPTNVIFPKTDFSKCTLNNWKISRSFSDTKLFNKNDITHKKDKREILKKEPIKTANPEPSIHSKMNLPIKPNSIVNFQIKSRQSFGRSTMKTDENNVHFPCKIEFSARPGPISKYTNHRVSTTFSNSVITEQSATTPSNEQHRPYAKTQIVYNVYDVSRSQQPGQTKGFRSHASFNLNIDRGPKYKQAQVYPLSAPPSGRLDKRRVSYNSKVDFGSGSTSLRQSFALSGKSPQSESPYESDVYAPSVYDPAPTSDYDTCCHSNVVQTEQRINDEARDDCNRTITISPIAYLKKCLVGKPRCRDPVQAHSRSVGSCTCGSFIETDQFSVQVENVDPECSYLKRFFGNLLYKDRCVVCTENKRVGTKYCPLRTYESEPDTCFEVKPSPSVFGLFKKMCKKEPEVDKKKARQKEREEKLKKQQRALAKAKREHKKRKEKKESEKLKVKQPRVIKEKREPSEFENRAKKGLAFTRRGYRRLTRRIRERYYRNKKMAEEQKGRYACDFYLMSLRTKPCLWVYYLCPVCYPYTLQILNLWRQVSDLLLFFVAIIVWSPCIICTECIKVLACNLCVF